MTQPRTEQLRQKQRPTVDPDTREAQTRTDWRMRERLEKQGSVEEFQRELKTSKYGYLHQDYRYNTGSHNSLVAEIDIYRNSSQAEQSIAENTGTRYLSVSHQDGQWQLHLPGQSTKFFRSLKKLVQQIDDYFDHRLSNPQPRQLTNTEKLRQAGLDSAAVQKEVISLLDELAGDLEVIDQFHQLPVDTLRGNEKYQEAHRLYRRLLVGTFSSESSISMLRRFARENRSDPDPLAWDIHDSLTSYRRKIKRVAAAMNPLVQEVVLKTRKFQELKGTLQQMKLIDSLGLTEGRDAFWFGYKFIMYDTKVKTWVVNDKKYRFPDTPNGLREAINYFWVEVFKAKGEK